jgi:hypothetical protein
MLSSKELCGSSSIALVRLQELKEIVPSKGRSSESKGVLLKEVVPSVAQLKIQPECVQCAASGVWTQGNPRVMKLFERVGCLA